MKAGERVEGQTREVEGACGNEGSNEDGLMGVRGMSTGFWTIRMDGFNGWNGDDWGVPNSSSAQEWEDGPPGTN